MNLLILGGTRFVGRHLTEAALSAGHQVSLFHRGLTNPDLFPEVEHLRGDRGGDLASLRGRRWDAALDLSGYLPREVQRSAQLLAGAVERYVFVSTRKVYADWKTPEITEDYPLEEPVPGDESLSEVPPDGYGRLKALCERFVEEALPGRVLVARLCIVVGPWDPFGRFAYWVDRTVRGGEVLAPGRPDRPVQLIDARDLAVWLVAMTERRETGIYNAAGPARLLTMREMLETCRAATGGEARFTWVPDAFLEQRGVRLPFWYPEESFGYDLLDNRRAIAKGLAFRPLAETVRDVYAWILENPDGRLPEDLSPEREAELLAERHLDGSGPW